MAGKVSRLPDWRPRLVAFLTAAQRAPFRPGQHDCALFAAGAVAAMTGQDYAAPYRGRYTTIRGGIRVLRADGFADHIALAAHHLPERPVAFARAGDLAVVPTEDGPALGVVQGAGIYVLSPAGGLSLVPLTAATRAFGV